MLKAIGAVVMLAVAAPAQAEPRCLSDLGTSRQTCVFGSLQDCVRAAAIGGGRCERPRLATGHHAPDGNASPSRRQRPVDR